MRTPMAALTLITSAIVLATSFAVSAEDEPTLDLPPAPNEDVRLIKEVCLDLITEQEIPLQDQHSFLLNCVNEQLYEMGYLAVEQIALN